MEKIFGYLREAFVRTTKCRLCLRITIGVFLAILVVEAGVLFFSVRNYEQDRIAEIEREAVVVMRAILRSTDSGGRLDSRFQSIASSLRDGSVLVGARVFDNDGAETAHFGERIDNFDLKTGTLEKTIRRFSTDQTRMDVAWPTTRLRSSHIVWAKIDTSEIGEQIMAFVWRIAGLVLLISFFVTAVTMFVLDRMVLAPILNLGNRMITIGLDPNHPEKYIVEPQRSDEWGDVLQAFNGMLRWSGSNLAKIKQNEAELQIAMDSAEAANRTKSSFLSSMSHELRTPMNAVLGFGQMLQFNPKEPLSESQNGYVENILTAGNHLLQLINEILDLAKIEAGNMEFAIEDVCVRSVLDECLVLTKSMADDRGIDVSIENGIDPDTKVRADETKFKQILLNLMSNAVKYNRDNGKVTIRVRKTADGKLHVAVTDTGVGISESSLADLFAPFKRFDAETTTIEGTGIGLTITKQFVENMGGKIGVQSEVGTGSTFWIELPLGA